MNKIKLLLGTAALLLTSHVIADNNKNISISDVWISEAPPTVSVLAAYARIENTSAEKQTLISVTSPMFSNIELHLSKVIDGMAHMEKQSTLVIPANSFIILSPGSYHLMLFNPGSTLKVGDKTNITFTFDDGTSSSVEANVKKRGNNEYKHHHGHHH